MQITNPASERVTDTDSPCKVQACCGRQHNVCSFFRRFVFISQYFVQNSLTHRTDETQARESVRLAFVRDKLLLVRDMLHVLNLVLVDLQLLNLIDTV